VTPPVQDRAPSPGGLFENANADDSTDAMDILSQSSSGNDTDGVHIPPAPRLSDPHGTDGASEVSTLVLRDGSAEGNPSAPSSPKAASDDPSQNGVCIVEILLNE
jgi:hypothetical protein